MAPTRLRTEEAALYENIYSELQLARVYASQLAARSNTKTRPPKIAQLATVLGSLVTAMFNDDSERALDDAAEWARSYGGQRSSRVRGRRQTPQELAGRLAAELGASLTAGLAFIWKGETVTSEIPPTRLEVARWLSWRLIAHHGGDVAKESEPLSKRIYAAMPIKDVQTDVRAELLRGRHSFFDWGADPQKTVVAAFKAAGMRASQADALFTRKITTRARAAKKGRGKRR
jgi:hypothetical protein